MHIPYSGNRNGHLLGGTGLRVSPLALGTMTFGQEVWGTDEEASRAVFNRYVEAGGNVIDTADVYASGRSERLVGKFVAESGMRDNLVVSTKFSQGQAVGTGAKHPNGTGNGRKHLLDAVDGSLRRLGTDHIDLYWLHIWDTITPVEEVMSTLDALVRAGKVRAIGLSNVPAWYAAKAQMLARHRGWEPVAALQQEYSLIERDVEREHVPVARDLNMGIVPWGPLAGGLLSGKYRRNADDIAGDGRLDDPAQRGVRELLGGLGDRVWRTVETVAAVAAETGATGAQVALNWVARRPGVSTTLIGARTLDQLEDNLKALTLPVSPEQADRLSTAGALPPVKQYMMHDPQVQQQILTPGFSVTGRPAWAN